MSEVNDWLKLLRGQISREKAEPLISKGIADLDDFLKADPQTEQRVVDILGRRLSGEINPETWEVMHSSLSQYFTESLAYLLYWVARVEDPTINRMPDVEKYASPEVMAFLRAVVGIYSADLSKAFTLAIMLPDNWRTIYREVYFDLRNQRYHFKIRILKYNNEEITIEGPPESVVELACQLIHTAALIGTRDAFSKASIDMFLDETRQFMDLLTAKEEEAPAEIPKSKKTK